MDSALLVKSAVRVGMVGGPTALLTLPGLTVITDPTFDPPAASIDGRPHRTSAAVLPKWNDSTVDLALVSHDQHPDNLDSSGRAFLKDVAAVYTTPVGAERLGAPARGLAPFETSALTTRSGTTVTVCAVPALHGPPGAEEEAGPVTGFVLTGNGLPTVYISGDNASLEAVDQVHQRFPVIDVALLFLGAAVVPHLMGGSRLTMNAEDAVAATRLLNPGAVVPLHCEGWSHYTEGHAEIQRVFKDAQLEPLLHIVSPGREVVL